MTLLPISSLIDRLLGRSRRDLAAAEGGLSLPFDLTHTQLRALYDLTLDPRWPELQALLDKMATLGAEELLVRRSSEDVHFLRGYVTGVRRAGTIIHELHRSLEANNERRIERSEQDRRRGDEHLRLATFGTRWWGDGE